MFSSEQWLANSGADFYNGVATQSLRFDGSSRLEKNFSSDGSKQKWTISVWVKRSNIEHNLVILGYSSSSSLYGALYFHNDRIRIYDLQSSSLQFDLQTNALHRDPSAWYHIVVSADTTQSTANNRIKMYVNGVQVTSFAVATYPSQNFNSLVTDDCPHMVGRYADENVGSFKGYMSEFNLVDGTQLTPTSFGEFKNSAWIAKDTSGLTFGTNGFRLKFDQVGVGTASTSTIGADTSGNTHHFTSSGIVASDCAMLDSPENNFCTLNALDKGSQVDLAEGSLGVSWSASAGHAVRSTFTISSGKWYAEFMAGASQISIGIAKQNNTGVGVSWLGSTDYGAGGSYAYNSSGTKRTNGSNDSYGATFASGDIIGVAFDSDNGTITFYKNGASQGEAYSGISGEFSFGLGYYGAPINSTKAIINFGQDGSFAGTLTGTAIGDETDDNGYGLFKYAPPSGFLSLCSANLPEPTIGANSATQADDHFETAIYTGNGGTKDITVGFQPDFSWYKCRAGGNSRWHYLFDSNRGANKAVYSNLTGAEDSETPTYNTQSFQPDGTRIVRTNGDHLNNNGDTYVSWNWKGGTNVSNTDGSITSTVSANTDAGFSIVTYTGTGANATVGHGLTVAPQMVIAKSRSVVDNWLIYAEPIGAGKYLDFTTTSSPTSITAWNNTVPTASVFTIGTAPRVNTASSTNVAYCFHSVEGYSKIGSYTGNGNADGTFVYVGFKPALIIIKQTNAVNNWRIIDNKRNGYNGSTKVLYPSVSNVEGAEVGADFVSNGFKLRATTAGTNASGGTFIYMAFAESSFKYANAR